jgi:hypothetical protein
MAEATTEELATMERTIRRIVKELSGINPDTTRPLARGSKEQRISDCLVDAQENLRSAINIIVKP